MHEPFKHMDLTMHNIANNIRKLDDLPVTQTTYQNSELYSFNTKKLY